MSTEKPKWYVMADEGRHINKKETHREPEVHKIAHLYFEGHSKAYATKTGVLALDSMNEFCEWLNERGVEPTRSIQTVLDGWRPSAKKNDPNQLLLPT